MAEKRKDHARDGRARGSGSSAARARPAQPSPAPALPARARPPRENRKRAVPARAAQGPPKRPAGGRTGGVEAASCNERSQSRRPRRLPPAPRRPRPAPGRRKSLYEAAPLLTREKGGRSGRRGDRGGSGSHGSHLRSASTRPGSAAPGTAPRDSRLIQEAAAGGASAAEKKKHAANAGSHHSSGARRRPLLIAGAATRVTRRASRRPRSPAPGMTQPSSARRAQPGEPDGGAHWPGPRRRPRPQQGAGPRGAGQPPPCGLALESPHRLAPPADYRQRARGTSPSPWRPSCCDMTQRLRPKSFLAPLSGLWKAVRASSRTFSAHMTCRARWPHPSRLPGDAAGDLAPWGSGSSSGTLLHL
ncbi:uncharacterized protein LOC112605322 [Theropithecus gelada]|uniref:uncharacterized protein LOC112605322 n=1 Tax=Theropithecus gelada TaxID=9565 RepID=UPI000DC1695C|nr:uncharacterized protein LOC112605322 [Theropithecus gelada]